MRHTVKTVRLMEYTAIYSTRTLKGVQYTFQSDSVQSAIRYASGKFGCFPNLVIIENDEDEVEDWTRGRVVFLNGDVVNGTYDVVFNDDSDSNSVGVNGSYDECMSWIESNRGDRSSYFGDYNGGTVSIYCEELEEYVYTESI